MLLIDDDLGPAWVKLVGYENRKLNLESLLTYTNLANKRAYNQFKKNIWFQRQHGVEAYNAELARLKKAQQVCLLKEHKGQFYTYSGLANRIARLFNDTIINKIQYPEVEGGIWKNAPQYELRYYQKDSVEALIPQHHASVSLPTGSGKAKLIVSLAHHYGLQTVIMCPTASIANQLFTEFTNSFGKHQVGLFGDGKKHLGKKYTVAIAASLYRIKPNSPEWNFFSKTQVFLSDESHLNPSESLEKVCMGVCAKAPYRYFVSATQMRNDGADLLLEGIIGPIVYKKELKELVDEGFLAKPKFTMVQVPSTSSVQHSDVLKEVKEHWHKNPLLYKRAAELVNEIIRDLDHQVLILIDHVDQFPRLLPYLKYTPKFAHGGVVDAKVKKHLPPEYHKSNTEDLVNQFNDNEIKLLVGTSCISIGTDIRPVKTIINLQGGVSEIKIRQAVGRGTRRVPGKTWFNYIDFIVTPQGDAEYAVLRHAQTRQQIYEEIYGPVKVI